MKVYKLEGRFYMDDNGTVVELTPNQDNYLKLPSNSTNRVWVSGNKVEKAPNQTIDYGTEIKEKRTFGPRTNTQATPKAPTTGLEEYLQGADKEAYLALVAKANKNREKAKLLAQIDQWTKMLEELGE